MKHEKGVVITIGVAGARPFSAALCSELKKTVKAIILKHQNKNPTRKKHGR
jgi:hypothetical protein